MIKIESIHKSYFTETTLLHVLKGLSLHIKEGELVSIMGSSYFGKSIFKNIL